jgi:hypothetical protein
LKTGSSELSKIQRRHVRVRKLPLAFGEGCFEFPLPGRNRFTRSLVSTVTQTDHGHGLYLQHMSRSDHSRDGHRKWWRQNWPFGAAQRRASWSSTGSAYSASIRAPSPSVTSRSGHSPWRWPTSRGLWQRLPAESPDHDPVAGAWKGTRDRAHDRWRSRSSPFAR